ncbi:hypothetical protein [Escherichia coli]
MLARLRLMQKGCWQ